MGLKIAQVAPLYEAVPPRFYGGTERVVANLTDALVDLGHHVTLFASAESRTKAKLVAYRDQAFRLDDHPLKSDMAAHLAMLHDVAKRADDFDILHFHTDILHFPLFEDIAQRTVTTLHGRLDMKDLPEVYKRWPSYPLVSISNNQRSGLPVGNWAATVHHGLPRDMLSPISTARPGQYLAFLGRISPEKRPDRAIEIARRTGQTLRIAAKVDAADAAYFRSEIEPLMKDAAVEFIGEIGETQKAEFLSGASALLFPVDWPEPFGLVMIEAMACGTPVIAWPCGSVPEVLDDGVTGFIVKSVDEAVSAVERVRTLNRATIRRVFEQRFAADVMARNYVRLYLRLLGRRHQPDALLKTA